MGVEVLDAMGIYDGVEAVVCVLCCEVLMEGTVSLVVDDLCVR